MGVCTFMLQCVSERRAMLMCVTGASWCVRACARCPGMRSSVRLRETDSGLSHVRPSCMYSSEPGERLSEQVNNHI